ncbi:methyl-accepting chemotaxis protein [Roseateles sp. BYS180W]|uniref:Methyl-accepting chemotaxis protein n=1 Tax=Roseateles rivi TaxID=3299028 RepID=A0ABW7FY07_9BURK
MARSLTITQRLLMQGAAASLCVLLGGALSFTALQQLIDAGRNMQLVGEALRAQTEADMMHDALRSDVLAALYAASQGDTPKQDDVNKDLSEHVENFTRLADSLKAMPLPEPVQQTVTQLRPKLDDYIRTAQSVVHAAFERPQAARQQLTHFDQSFKVLEEDMEKLSDQIAALNEEQQAANELLGDNTLLLIGALALATPVVLLVLSVMTARRVAGPLAQAVVVTRTVATGDLSAEVVEQGDREARHLLKGLADMTQQLSHVVGEVRDTAQTIATGSEQIAAGSNDLSRRTEEQASNLEQTAASMEELAGTVRENAANAQRAEAKALAAASTASQSGHAVSQVVHTMEDIARSSSRIGDIIGVIDSIAFQTNILALNAAVEAARAGEQGRGFAVVASEVRALAQRSASAAREIKTLIQESSTKVHAGTAQVSAAGDTVQDMVKEVNEVAALLQEINRASQQQATGLGEIGCAVSRLDQVTQQNAALVEQSTAAADSLAEQAQRLSALMTKFKLR